jgi:hypothetical protein
MKLNLSEVKNYSIFEGEIVVVDGFNDAGSQKFNVVRIHKPQAIKPQCSLPFNDVKQVTI